MSLPGKDGARNDPILVLDPDPESLARIVGEIEGLPGVQAAATSQASEALQIAARGDLALMILDVKAGNLEDGAAIENLKRFREACPSAGLIVLTTYADTDDLYRVFQVEGVRKYLLKPWKPAYGPEVEEALNEWREARTHEARSRALVEERAELARGNEALRIEARDRHPWSLVVARSPRMGEACLRSRAQAASDRNVVLFGEPGTGKRLLARLIHYQGARGAGPLMEVHGGIFRGGAKGGIDPDIGLAAEAADSAPTLAMELLAAKWQVARGGTLLVRQLDELPDSLQSLLARLVMEGRSEETGRGDDATSPDPAGRPPRILATASDAPPVMRLDGRISAALLEAIDPIPIEVPPLRGRQVDLPELTLTLLRTFSERYRKPVRGMAGHVLSVLFEHEFPGNVSELEMLLERAVAGVQGTVVEVSDLRIA